MARYTKQSMENFEMPNISDRYPGTSAEDIRAHMNFLMQRGYTREAAEKIALGNMNIDLMNEALTSSAGNSGAKASAGKGIKGWFGSNGGGIMKNGFTLPTLNQAFGNANLGYSLGGGYYDQTAKRFLKPDEIAFFKNNGNLQKALDSGALKKTDAGLNIGGYQLGKLYTGGLGAIEGFRAIKNLDSLNKVGQDTSDIKSNILATAASTPNAYNYLTMDEQKMLNQLKRGNYSGESWGSDIGDWGGVLGGGVKGALAGLPGGIPGMIVGGIGGALNSGISGATKKKEMNNSKLDSLYNTLNYARNDYNSMKRPNFSGLGLQQRYRNAYM